MRHIFSISVLLGLALVASCGYRFGQGEISCRYSSISVPYVEGDVDGSLTAAVIREVGSSTSLEYYRSGGDLILKVVLLDLRDENIGFRYDRHKKGGLKKTVVPIETRIIALVEVTLIEATSGNILRGPVKLASSVDFDHDYYSSRNGVNIFSLGQLSDVDEARDAVHRPLNHALAQKIVDYINDSW